MSPSSWSIRRPATLDEQTIQGLADVLIDCVAGGASVSFMHPLTRERALEFWRRVADGVAAGERVVLVAEDDQSICGTVQLILNLPENQPHRADLAKMLVHSRVRRKGLGAALLRAAEDAARDCGKSLLVLDTVTGGPAEQLYSRLGWIRAGVVPNFALMPDGAPCGTTYFYRNLNAIDTQPDSSEQKSGIQIRPYQATDEAGIVELWKKELSDSAPHNDPVTVIRDKMRDSPDQFFVAVVDGAVAGTAMGGYDGHRGWIYSVAVAEPFRRRGIGSALMRQVEEMLKDCGCLKVNLQVRAGNDEAVAFYEQLGYSIEDRVSMGKRLY